MEDNDAGNKRLSRLDPDHSSSVVESEHSDDSLVVRADKDFIVSLILSLGIASSLVVFVFASFAHPNEATILIPLIVGPVGAAIVRLMKRDCPRCKELPKNDGH